MIQRHNKNYHTRTISDRLTQILGRRCHQWQRCHAPGDSIHPSQCYQKISALVGHHRSVTKAHEE